MGIARGWEKRVIRTNITYAKRTVRSKDVLFFFLVFIREKIINYMMSMEDETVGDKPTETVEELIQKVRKVNFSL